MNQYVIYKGVYWNILFHPTGAERPYMEKDPSVGFMVRNLNTGQIDGIAPTLLRAHQMVKALGGTVVYAPGGQIESDNLYSQLTKSLFAAARD